MSDDDCARFLDQLDAAGRRSCTVDWRHCAAVIGDLLTMLDSQGCGASTVALHLEAAAISAADEARPLAA